MREHEIRKAVRQQLICAIEDDMNDGERLMKEVWEELANNDEFDIAKDELRKIIERIKELAC